MRVKKGGGGRCQLTVLTMGDWPETSILFNITIKRFLNAAHAQTVNSN